MIITVVVCTYNRCQMLAEALDYIVASRVPKAVAWEILVVDNNSHDRTREVVADFQGRYPGRFRYLFEPQQGKTFALNAAIRQTHSEILAFADDDAAVDPDWLWSLASVLRDKDLAGAGGRIIPVWPKPLPHWLSTGDPHTMGPFNAFDPAPAPGPLRRPPYGANMAFRREAFDKYGVFRTDLGCGGSGQGREDIEFGGRLLAGGGQLWYEPRAIVCHPVTEDRMSRKYVLTWWFRFGWWEIFESGPPSDVTMLRGVPLYLLRRFVRWMLQSFVVIGAPRRFAAMRNVWYLAGLTAACYQWPQRLNAHIAASAALGSPSGSLREPLGNAGVPPQARPQLPEKPC